MGLEAAFGGGVHCPCIACRSTAHMHVGDGVIPAICSDADLSQLQYRRVDVEGTFDFDKGLGGEGGGRVDA